MINQTEQTLENRLARELTDVKRELNALKTRQKFGGDNLVYSWSGNASASFTIAGNSHQNLTATITSLVVGVPIFPIFFSALYVNASSAIATQLWPTGSGLAPDEKQIRFSWSYNLFSTSADAMTWVVTIQIFNSLGSSIPYYIDTAWRFPRLSV